MRVIDYQYVVAEVQAQLRSAQGKLAEGDHLGAMETLEQAAKPMTGRSWEYERHRDLKSRVADLQAVAGLCAQWVGSGKIAPARAMLDRELEAHGDEAQTIAERIVQPKPEDDSEDADEGEATDPAAAA